MSQLMQQGLMFQLGNRIDRKFSPACVALNIPVCSGERNLLNVESGKRAVSVVLGKIRSPEKRTTMDKGQVLESG